jgi:hypothetical protein
MSKFKNNLTLSNKELKAKRAGVVEEDAKIGAQDVIRVLTDKRRVLKRKLMDLEDFGPENTTSLRPTAKGFSGENWFNELASAKLELKLLNAKIKIYKKAYSNQFEEEKEVVVTEAEQA